MSIPKNKNLSFLLICILFAQCTVKYVKKDPNFSQFSKSTKRIVVFGDVNASPSSKESQTLTQITRELLSHHSEFIVYPTPEKFDGKCSPKLKKVEGILSLNLTQNIQKKDQNLVLNMSLKKCPENLAFWDAKAEDSFDLDSQENESLRNTYTQKFGKEVNSLVNGFFQIAKILVEKLESPVLTEEEKDEKIDVDSQ